MIANASKWDVSLDERYSTMLKILLNNNCILITHFVAEIFHAIGREFSLDVNRVLNREGDTVHQAESVNSFFSFFRRCSQRLVTSFSHS